MSGKNWLEYEVTPEDAGMTVERIIRERLAVSGRMLQRLTRSKGVQLNRKAPFLGRQVKAGDRVSVRIGEQRRPDADLLTQQSGVLTEQEMPVEILFEDEHFLLVNKPAGMMVHPVNQEQTGTLVHVLAAYLQGKKENPSVHPVHRLDKETTGAVLIGKSGYAHQLADRLLREGEIDRQYLAVVSGRLAQDSGTIDAPIARDPSHKTKRQVSDKGEAAVTHYQVEARTETSTLVKVRLETGRTHQIRVHFAHIGHPLAGDTLYGAPRGLFRRQALHADRISFTHPVSKRMIEAKAPLPADLAALIEKEYGLTV